MIPAGFHDDILRHPGDDTPRLVLADWLDEHDQPERAELIRLQCERAKLPPEPKTISLCGVRESLLCSYQSYEGVYLNRNGRMPVRTGEHCQVDCGSGLVYPDAQIVQATRHEVRPFVTRVLFRRTGWTDTAGQRRRAILHREKQLLDAHRLSWIDGFLGRDWETRSGGGLVSFIRDAEQTQPFNLIFGRGFIEEVVCQSRDFFKFEQSFCWHADQRRPLPPSAQPIRSLALVDTPEIQFGPEARFQKVRSEPGGGLELDTLWDAWIRGRIPERQFIRSVLTDRHVQSGVEQSYREEHALRVQKARTPLGYLKSKWPWIDFTIGHEAESLLVEQAMTEALNGNEPEPWQRLAARELLGERMLPRDTGLLINSIT